MTTLIPIQKAPIPPQVWETVKSTIYLLARRSGYSERSALVKAVFTHQNIMGQSMKPAVDAYNTYFNTGKPEPMGCYPCVRKVAEFLRRVIVSEAPIIFDGPDVLKVYAIYEHPKDFPNEYVIRLWLNINGQPNPVAMAGLFFRSTNLEDCTKKMEAMRLYPIDRSEYDDPVILKTYI